MTARAQPPRRTLDGRLRTSLVAVAAAGASLAAVSLLLFGPRVAFSVAAGSALATANLWALAHIVAALLPHGGDGAAGDGAAPPEGANNVAAWAIVGLLKMLGLIVVVWLLMHHGVVAPLPMVVGFGALPIGIAIGSIVSDRGAKA
jgi:hypothetical protein